MIWVDVTVHEKMKQREKQELKKYAIENAFGLGRVAQTEKQLFFVSFSRCEKGGQGLQ